MGKPAKTEETLERVPYLSCGYCFEKDYSMQCPEHGVGLNVRCDWTDEIAALRAALKKALPYLLDLDPQHEETDPRPLIADIRRALEAKP